MELTRSTSRGGFSVRSIFTFVLSVIIAAFLWAISAGSTTYAAEASWNGASLTYDNRQFISAGEAKAGESHGLAEGTQYYVSVEQVAERPVLIRKAHVIYFASGVDPPAATSATYVVYDLFDGNRYANPHNEASITITPQGTSTTATSCAIEGVGWWVCSISNFLADGMDWVFDVLAGFMEVQPAMVGDSTNDLYVAWSLMRTIANVAFIIVFLIIIYSQMTNVGISNYGLKKLLPRLIIGAVLVNISYYLCAIAIDLSNILGYSLQDMFMGIREGLFKIDETTWTADMVSWESITGFVLSGGTIALAGGIGAAAALYATGGTITAAIFLLLPALLSLILVVLVVLLILAARQAIITILLIISPLAFVAYLLPNTEKLFNKWRELFTTMLVFFPAFAVVFGGSQLAGGLIIQNANSINVIILGMIVQVAPLIITPLLMKLSGNLLSKIGALVNDPRKGMVDRTRNWAKGHAENQRLKGIGNAGKNPFRRAARRMEYNKHRLEQKNERWKAGFDEYAKKRDYTTRRGQETAMGTALSKLGAEEMENSFNQAMQEARAGDASGLHRLRLNADKTVIESIRLKLGNQTLEQVRITNSQSFTKFAQKAAERASHLDQESRITESAIASAKNVQQQRFAEAIDSSEALQKRAGGIDQNGAQRSLANAFAVISKAREETIANAGKIIDHRNLSNEQVRLLAEGQTIPNVNITMSQDIRAAALQRTLGGPDTEQIVAAMKNIDFSFAGLDAKQREELQVVAGKALEGNSSRPPEVGAGVIGKLKQGLDYTGNTFTGALGNAGVANMIVAAVNAQKLDAGKLQSAGKDYTDQILSVLSDPQYFGQLSAAAKDRLRAELGTVLDPTREASERLGDSRPGLEGISNLL